MSNTLVSEFLVFVTSYAVGNEHGFAAGKHFDLSDFSDKEEFIEAAQEYMSKTWGDHDPELAFPDYEIPFNDENLISEGHISSELWEVMALDEDDLKMVEAFIGAFGNYENQSVSELLEQAQGKLRGQWESDSDMAYDHVEETGAISADTPDFIRNAIDYDSVAECLMQDYTEHNGYYFYAH